MQCQESRTRDWVQFRNLGILSPSKIAKCWKGTLYVVGNKNKCQYIKYSLGASRNGAVKVIYSNNHLPIRQLKGRGPGNILWGHAYCLISNNLQVMLKEEIWISLENQVEGSVVKRKLILVESPHIRVHSTPPLTRSRHNEFTYCLEGQIAE